MARLIDAVEVVRCKDCVSYKEYGWCDFFKEVMREDGYCSCGEKMDGGDKE